MTPGAFLWLLRRDLLSQRMRLLLLVACISLSGLLVGLVFSAVSYLRAEVRPRLRQLFPENRVLVKPSQTEVMFLSLGGAKIGDKELDTFRAMREVGAVYPQLGASFPISAEFSMQSLGVGFSTDVIAFGVDEGLVASDVALPDAKFATGDPMPVLISEYFLDAYNLGFADSAGLPRLTRKAAIGIEFDLLLGESVIGIGTAKAGATPRRQRCRIVGMTPNPLLFGVIVPMESMKSYEGTWGPKKPREYAALHIDLRSPEDSATVEAEAKRMGLRFEAQRGVLERYMKVLGSIELLLASGLAVVLAIACVGIFTTMAAAIRERRPAWGLHRATGLSRKAVLLLATGHALGAAIPASVISVGLLFLISHLLNKYLGGMVAQLSFFPGDPFAIVPLTPVVMLAASVLLALVPAWMFTIPIMHAKPVELLAERSL